VVYVIGKGFDLMTVMALDLDRFCSLVNSCKRNDAMSRQHSLWDGHFSANASGKELRKYEKDFIRPYMTLDHDESTDINRALSDFGKGF